MLPVTADGGGGAASGTVFSNLFKGWDQMDLEFTFTQYVYLCKSPSKVYKLTSWRKQTKNQWARDDPAFVVILVAFVLIATV